MARTCKYTRHCLGQPILSQLVTMLIIGAVQLISARQLLLGSRELACKAVTSMRTHRLGKSYASAVARIQETLLRWGGGGSCYLHGKPIARETHIRGTCIVQVNALYSCCWDVQNPTRGKATAEGQANRQLKYRQTCKQADGGHDDPQ